jgi:flagellar assembly protein FliH
LPPPRLHQEESEDETEEVSGLHPAPAAAPRAEVAENPAKRLSSPPEVEARRRDTMIDDIVPRAEEEAVAQVRGIAAEIVADRDRIGAESEARLVELALLVARRVIAREVSMDPSVVLGLVREGIAALGEKDRLVVRVGRFFGSMRTAIEADLATAKLRCDVVVDPSLGETGCVVETELGRVDESVEVRLANLVAGLSSRERGRR